MVTHSSILAWEIPWIEEDRDIPGQRDFCKQIPGQSMGLQKSWTRLSD